MQIVHHTWDPVLSPCSNNNISSNSNNNNNSNTNNNSNIHSNIHNNFNSSSSSSNNNTINNSSKYSIQSSCNRPTKPSQPLSPSCPVLLINLKKLSSLRSNHQNPRSHASLGSPNRLQILRSLLGVSGRFTSRRPVERYQERPLRRFTSVNIVIRHSPGIMSFRDILDTTRERSHLSVRSVRGNLLRDAL